MAAPRSVRDIDEHLAAVVARRTSVRFAIRRRRDDIAQADNDLLAYERQLVDCDDQLEQLLDERDRSAHPEKYAADALIP